LKSKEINKNTARPCFFNGFICQRILCLYLKERSKLALEDVMKKAFVVGLAIGVAAAMTLKYKKNASMFFKGIKCGKDISKEAEGD